MIVFVYLGKEALGNWTAIRCASLEKVHLFFNGLEWKFFLFVKANIY